MTLLLSTLFFLMIVAPCVVALRSAHKSDENDAQAEVERHEFQAVTALPEKAKATSARPRTLREMATEAEAEARAAHEVARKAHRVALAADAKAAKLRADVAAEAAVEAGREAQKAILAVEATLDGEYLPTAHPSFNFPPARVVRRRAA
jgi:hypothetical protein